MLRCFYLPADGSIQTDLPAEALREAARDENGVLWADFEDPTDEETALLDEVFGFHPLSIEDCMHASQHTKVDDFGEYMFVVTLAPDRVAPGQEELDLVEVDFYLSSHYLVTYHKPPARSVTLAAERVRRQPAASLRKGVDFLFHDILDGIVDQYLFTVAAWDRIIDEYEPRILESPDKEILGELIEYKSGLLQLRQTTLGHAAILDQILRGGFRVVGENTRIYLSNIRDHLGRVLREVDLCRDATNAARDLYLSMLSNRTNESMRVLAIVATVMLPLTLVASIYGMNFEDLPGKNSEYGFWIMSAVMVLIAGCMIGLFKWKKWL